MTTSRATETELTPPTPLPATLAYASPTVVTARGSVPLGRAVVLSVVCSAGQLLGSLAVADVHTYLYIAPELPGSRMRDAFRLAVQYGSFAVLTSPIFFVTLRLHQFSPARSKQRRAPVIAAAVAGLAHLIVVAAAWHVLTSFSHQLTSGVFFIALGFPVLAGLWIGRLNNREGNYVSRS